MLSRQVFDVYRSPMSDESIERIETRTHYPYVKSFQNNDTIEIAIQQSDAWLLMYDAAINIQGRLNKTAGAGTIKFVNNAGAFMFESMTYELNGKELDNVRKPAIVSTLRGYTCYEAADSNYLGSAGWNYPLGAISNAADGSFNMWIPLRHLFGIFNDYTLATCGKQTLRLVRSRSDKSCALIDEVQTPTTPTKFELIINSVVLKVKHIFPNDEIRMNLLQSIKLDRPVLIPYRRWELHELPALTVGSTKEIWAVKTCSAVESPRYIITAFQTDRNSDATLFDNINIMDIRLTLNGTSYPHERMRLDFAKNDYVEAHRSYTEFYSSYMNSMRKHAPLLNYDAFKNRAIFVIDCSKRTEFMKSTTVDVKLDIESTIGFPVNTRAYCIIIHDCIMEHLPLSEIVRQLS